MYYLEINGGKKLSGEVVISGAKNAALPVLVASILSKNEVVFENVPQTSDINTLLNLLSNLGATCSLENNIAKVNPIDINNTRAVYDIVRKMRASILVLGPLLARFNECEVSLPGGCAIGSRPIDLHLMALEKMGAKIKIEEGYVKASGKLKGADIVFDKITVGGTENILMAAALADGVTTITNAAIEPEIVQLCEVLVSGGVRIDGIGTNSLKVYGKNELLDIKHVKVIPDRIEAGTYMCAAAITNSNLRIKNIIPKHLTSVIQKLEQMGVPMDIGDDYIDIKEHKGLKAVNIQTSEYPGFPTDMQAQFMALCAIANGVSTIDERLFENRFMHVSELCRMSANISLNGHLAVVTGVDKLTCADVMATDLRASSALVLASLATKGISRVHRIYHLERGYEKLCEKLQSIGADIKRLQETSPNK